MKTPNLADYMCIQNIIDTHPDGLLSRDLSVEYYGDDSRPHVTQIIAKCEKGRRLGLIDYCRRRADLSTYTVWYPADKRGIPVTYVERLTHELGTFTIPMIKKRLREDGVAPEVHIKKAKMYLDLMVEDGTLAYCRKATANGNGYTWVEQ